MEITSIKLSVIIPTYQAENRITKILENLKTQTDSSFELIIVNDGSTDRTEQKINSYKNEFKNFKKFKIDNCGRAQVRNFGAKQATGNLLIFFDDDMHLGPNCIKQHIEYHLKNNNHLLVGNGYRNKNWAKTSFQYFILDMENKWMKNHQNQYYINLSNPRLTACNFSIPKIIFDKLNGFDKNLKDSEDMDLGIRALEEGYKVFYNQDIDAWHNDDVSFLQYVKRNNEYKNAAVKLLALKPNYTAYIPKYINEKKASILKKSIYNIFKNKNVLQILFKISEFKMKLPFLYSFYQLALNANQNHEKQ